MFDSFHAHGKTPTHVLMDGGILHVTPDRLNEFFSQYVQYITASKQIFVVEQKTPVYRLFVDIDYVDEEALTFENIQHIAHIICDKVKALCKVPTTQCIVSVAKPKPKNTEIKTGIHLNWPDITVNQEQALYIRDYIISQLSKVYSAKKWGKIIDSSVYGNPKTGSHGSGFRLPWSHKKIKDTVEGPYIPIMSYDNGTFTDISKVPVSVEFLKRLAIRTTDTHPNVSVKPPGVFTLPTTTPVKKGKVGTEVSDCEISAELETFIRRNLRGQGHARIQKIMREKSVYVIQTDSKYCENIGKAHSSNHIWFKVHESGVICQKCFCTCDTTRGRKNGFCKEFSGQEHTLPGKIVKLMYPDVSQKHEQMKQNVYTHLNLKNTPATDVVTDVSTLLEYI